MTTLFGLLPIDIIAILALGWVVIGLAGMSRKRDFRFITGLLYPLGAVSALLLAVAAFISLDATPQVMELPIGLPDLPVHLRLDALSAFFLLILGGATFGISTYICGYIRQGEGTAPGLQCLEYHVFLASMVFVILADDAYTFMVAWETMAMSSFFLVTSDHKIPEIRRAGYLYLLLAHIGAIGILLSFGVLQAAVTQDGVSLTGYTFAAMRGATHSGMWASVAFFLALFGFGAKAGLLPLHAWLPEAHPAAPSPVSAMMSGVMLKTAIYGSLRVSFDLLHVQLWWWGIIVLAFGLMTALFGVFFAAVQTDMKRLLAYSSIENMGIIFVGLGLAITFQAFHMPMLAALALTATLYHCLNHAFFKSLLFLCTGSVLHATKSRNLGTLGGLIRPMPWVGWLALLGVLASAGLPPFNGFVSEWLLLQSFLFTPGLPQGYINMLVPVAAAAVALVGALAGYVMVKFYGIVFLGQHREAKLSEAHDASRRERIGLAWLGLVCILLGILPNWVIGKIDAVTQVLLHAGLGAQVAAHGWFLAPISPERASFNPLLFLAVIAGVMTFTFVAVRRLWHGRVRRAPAWDCGFPLQNARMQDTAEGLSQPLINVFEPFYRITRDLPSAFDRHPRYRIKVEDPLWFWVYLPVARATDFIAGLVCRLQQGRIAVYLMYSFVTLLTLLFLISR